MSDAQAQSVPTTKPRRLPSFRFWLCSVIILACAFAFAFLALFRAPKYVQIYADFDASLPLMSRFAVILSQQFQALIIIAAPMLAACCAVTIGFLFVLDRVRLYTVQFIVTLAILGSVWFYLYLLRSPLTDLVNALSG